MIRKVWVRHKTTGEEFTAWLDGEMIGGVEHLWLDDPMDPGYAPRKAFVVEGSVN